MHNLYPCPHCSGVFHELVPENVIKDTPANGTWFSVLPHVVASNWQTFEEAKHVFGENLSCPECEQSYVDPVTGKLIDAA